MVQGRRYTTRVTIRLSATEFARLRRMAEAQELRVAELVRVMLKAQLAAQEQHDAAHAGTADVGTGEERSCSDVW
jgi:predicted transcriptional regulator